MRVSIGTAVYNFLVIAHNLKVTREQIIDDLNGVMSSLQRRMMKELLIHLDELNIHIRNLDDEIDNFRGSLRFFGYPEGCVS